MEAPFLPLSQRVDRGAPLCDKKSVPQPWLQLSLKAPPPAHDAVANFFIERGSPGVVFARGEVRAFFRPLQAAAVRRDVGPFLRDLRKIYPGFADKPLRWRPLAEKNWAKSWRRFFAPVKIGRTLWIAPPWIDPPKSRRHAITIEPGMAFGTGTHSTTRACLEFIEEIMPRFDRGKLRALDIGTGSGILAIALAKFGAASVVALDNDPVALKVARDNIRVNDAARQIRLTRTKVGTLGGRFGIVVANLISETILELADALAACVAPGGYLVLSGILYWQGDEIVRRFVSARFKMVRRRRGQEWVTLLLKKKS
ncbi:MAG TPA: 50S ribosomal protein L11 methyltransferase [Candidatus Binatia bacterium]|jgi:ribosomal protein L11 methyltransferase